MTWATGPDRRVHVRVPATSANLGPGFDALGLALALHDDVEAWITDSGLTIEVTGEGESQDLAGAGEKHLVVQAMRAGFDAFAGRQPPGLALRCANRIPHGRGLGSSAAAIVAGLLAAQALSATEPAAADPAAADPVAAQPDILALATDIEGHPDNVAACLVGGLTIAWVTPTTPASPSPGGGFPPAPLVWSAWTRHRRSARSSASPRPRSRSAPKSHAEPSRAPSRIVRPPPTRAAPPC